MFLNKILNKTMKIYYPKNYKKRIDKLSTF